MKGEFYPRGGRNREKLIIAFGNNPVAFRRQGEEKRVSVVKATGLQTLVLIWTGVLKPLIF